jgi:hypothetical protein
MCVVRISLVERLSLIADLSSFVNGSYLIKRDHTFLSGCRLFYNRSISMERGDLSLWEVDIWSNKSAIGGLTLSISILQPKGC